MYEELKEMLCKELDEITRKGELTAGSLEAVDKLTHSIKNIDTIVAMEESRYSNDGHSNRGRAYYDDMPTSNARGKTGNVRRDSMGKYSNDGLSYDEAKEDMIDELRQMMHEAPDERTKMRYKNFIKRFETM